jgi:hypothetical protein
MVAVYLKKNILLGTGAHICDPSYSGHGDRRIMVQGQSEQNVCETPSQPIKGGCGGTHLSYQLLWEALNRRTMFQADLGTNTRTYKKNYQKNSKISGVWLKWESTCPESAKP